MICNHLEISRRIGPPLKHGLRGTYTGPRKHLYGQRAILIAHGKHVLAQFDDLKGLPRHYTCNWTRFARSQWRIES